MLTALEMFTLLNPKFLVLKPTPLLEFPESHVLNKQRAAFVTKAMSLHAAQEPITRDVTARKEKIWTHKQAIGNAKTNIILWNLIPGDYVLVRSNCKKGHNGRIERHGPMRIINTESERIFKAENLTKSERRMAHGQRTVACPAIHHASQITHKLIEPSKHLTSTYHMIEEITRIGQSNRIIESHVDWLGCQATDKT